MNKNIALIVVDIQNDFFEDGALPVDGATNLLLKINSAIATADVAGWPIVVTRDWHPEEHSSFKTQGGPWPVHCVAGSTGAQFHPDLLFPHDAMIISKGESIEGMGYSSFKNEEFVQTLKERGITRLIVVGIALECCVKATCVDAHDIGFNVIAVKSLVASVSQDTAVIEKQWEELESSGITVIRDFTQIDGTKRPETIDHDPRAQDTSSNS